MCWEHSRRCAIRYDDWYKSETSEFVIGIGRDDVSRRGMADMAEYKLGEYRSRSWEF